MTDLFCPTFASTGKCLDGGCRLNHTNCVLCQKSGLQRKVLWKHMRTDEHQKRFRRYLASVPWTCVVCNRSMYLSAKATHEAGEGHRQALASLFGQNPWIAGPISSTTAAVHHNLADWRFDAFNYSMPLSSNVSYERGEDHTQALVELSNQQFSGPVQLSSTSAAATPHVAEWKCKLCNVSMPPSCRKLHKRGGRHKQALAELSAKKLASTGHAPSTSAANPNPAEWTCDLCHCSMPSSSKRSHLRGKRHSQALAEQSTQQDARTIQAPSASAANPNPAGWTCELCHCSMPPSSKKSHLRGKRHKQALAEQSTQQPTSTAQVSSTSAAADPDLAEWRCELCNRSMNLSARKSHERGKSHKRALGRLSAPQPSSAAQVSSSSTATNTVSRPTYIKCGLCNQSVIIDNWSAHLADPAHIQKARLAAYRQDVEKGSEDKYGVRIFQAELDFGTVDLGSLVDRPIREDALYVQADHNAVGIVLTNVQLSSKLGNFSELRDVNFSVHFSSPLPLENGVPFAVKIAFDPRGNRGRYEDRVEFSFEQPSTGAKFVIHRIIKALVTVEVHRRQLAPVAPYMRPKRRPRGVKGSITVTDGTRPSNFEQQKIAWTYRLPEYNIHPSLNKLLEDGTIESKVERISNNYVPLGLRHQTYAPFWANMLWVEEYQASKDMENYDQTDVQFAGRFGRNYLLEVPGLAERRPSVVIGDSVLVRPTESKSSKWFRGFVHGVQMSHVMLGFHSSFSFSPGQRFDVEFELNRLLFQRQHLAVCSKYKEREVLFPRDADILEHRLTAPSREDMSGATVFDTRVAANLPQLQAATAIARLPPGTIPFIIFGPPGTGKTVTVVEAIRQVLARQPAAKVLACAPSNSAADIIADRLRVALRPSQLFRLNAPSRVKDLPRNLEDYSLRYDDGSFRVPSPSVLKQYRVVVATCASGSIPHGVGVKEGHFTHIFVDEAGQTSEPEVMIPIKMNAAKNTTIILAGDPKQLGPVIRSPVARRLGLELSYLDRLMALDMYKATENRGVTHVKLTKNWRSHAAIIDFPNHQFYGGELEACADPSVSNIAIGWEKLPNPTYPVVFHAMKGQDMREASSPSWFNIEEASAVRDYVQALRQDPRIGLKEEQIGVITPYRSQVRKVRTILHIDSPNVKVGTTEEFQGDERHAIIVSTVRSSLDFVEFDLRHTLGFVANPRRLNVAITRAKAILIVVGDPDVLGLDPLWRRFLNQVRAYGGWRGMRIPWDPREEVPTHTSDGSPLQYDTMMRGTAEQDLRNLVARTAALGLDALDEVEGMEADADMHWREDE